jgi:hypothetical protein
MAFIRADCAAAEAAELPTCSLVVTTFFISAALAAAAAALALNPAVFISILAFVASRFAANFEASAPNFLISASNVETLETDCLTLLPICPVALPTLLILAVKASADVFPVFS